jgi:rhodanese-related sulfurtransferase
MQTTLNSLQDPARAMVYFQQKLAFTTGPVELDQLIKSGENSHTVIDVREAEDYAKGHIPGAINLPKGTWENPKGLAKDKINVVYCYTQQCHLAAKACALFAANGFPVMELEGGFAAWKDSDMDIEREPVNRLKKASERLFHRK